ncbi:MAG: spermidine/putrescine ABC transporter substrate-binding protein [Anaerolineae bacterium]
MRKLISVLFCAVLLLGVFPVLGQDEEAPEITWECPEGFEGQTLNVYNWSTYIGETTITDFEELCGVEVIYDVYESNEAMIARLRQGNPGYDVAFPSDYAIAIMARDGLIQPVDQELIPNLEFISERWRGLPFDPENEYTVPYLIGTLGVAYNIEAVGEDITSWEQVFNYDGPVAWIDDPRSMIGIALQMLGYNPNTTDEDEIAEARDYLIERGGNVASIADDDGQTLLARGEVDIAVEFNGDVYQVFVDCECDDYAYVLPEEGAVADIAGLVLLTDAPNPELAHAFMDYILDPVVNALIVNDVLYGTPNLAAIETGIIPDELLNNQAVFPPDAVLETMFFVQDVEDVEQAYSDAWDEITILIGG